MARLILFKTLEVGGPTDRSDRIAPDDEIGMVRGEKELGELPADMIYVSYPNAHFFGDEVVLLYDQLDASTDLGYPYDDDCPE